MDLPFYLAFPTGIYLFKMNNKSRSTLCEICSKLTGKAPDQMCGTTLLQMYSFSIILTSHHSLSLWFLLLFYVISTAIFTTFKFPPWFPTSSPWFPTFFAFPPRFLAFPRQFPARAFPPHSSHSHPYLPTLIPFPNSPILGK